MNKGVVWTGVAIPLLVFAIGTLVAQDNKETPANVGSQACLACHESAAALFKRNSEAWGASAHSKALGLVVNNSQSSPDCYSCHSDEGFKAKAQGKKVDLVQKASFNPVTCVTCHKVPHEAQNNHQLVMDPETLCSSCHTQRSALQGKGARGIEETRSFHSAVDCISCHMTDGTHSMKVFRPDDPEVSENRVDTCTACHKDNNRKARITQLQEWQASYKLDMDRLQAEVNTISAALKENPALLDDNMKSKLNDVRFNLSILVRDRSRGAHNVDFTGEILSVASKSLKEIEGHRGQTDAK